MKKTYLSPEVEVEEMVDVFLSSTPALDLGGGDWGVRDEL